MPPHQRGGSDRISWGLGKYYFCDDLSFLDIFFFDFTFKEEPLITELLE